MMAIQLMMAKYYLKILILTERAPLGYRITAMSRWKHPHDEGPDQGTIFRSEVGSPLHSMGKLVGMRVLGADVRVPMRRMTRGSVVVMPKCVVCPINTSNAWVQNSSHGLGFCYQ
jgi:hypothetical protein